ncbi:hypothetical protein UPYG_G00079580 [Umbra pygmaea]|uniref:Uncharacterized protein n=1 Tax=Umbra pygmaea TaxID=75934 RepID=A0ABD0XGH5_UMBPY
MNMSVIMEKTAAVEPVVEMPEEISLPLASLEEVDQFEGWLKNPANTAKKQHMVGMLASIGAVRKNRMSDKATVTEINQYAIRWFNLACDRGGGRRARSHPTNEQ